MSTNRIPVDANEIAAVKANHDSLRKRLAARRQKRQHLIADATAAVSVLRPSSSTSRLVELINSKRKLGSPADGVSSKMLPSETNVQPSNSAVKFVTSFNSSHEQHPTKGSTLLTLTTDAHSPPALEVEASAVAVDDVTARELPLHVGGPDDVVKIDASSGSELETLLAVETAKERELKRMNDEVLELLNTPTAMELFLNEKFKSQGGSQVQLFCVHGTRQDCFKALSIIKSRNVCSKLHFRKIIHSHTDESLGDCSFLNTCFHVDTCKYVHYEIDPADLTTDEAMAAAGAYNRGQLRPENFGKRPEAHLRSFTAKSDPSFRATVDLKASNGNTSTIVPLYPPQWINCDVRQLDMAVLGKFAVIMADPPWDIHMELPYGTMSDDEMRRLDIPRLQDDGYLFLWVTGRAMELGRECLQLWGYKRVDEIIWVKTNQLQRLIRTGRTGHWLNHGKEHCLVGVKGNPKGMNKGLDCDVIVSEVRETSRKPDEIYGIIERLAPGSRKLELFGRPHNVQANWLTLGNQLDGTYLVDPAVVERYKKRYPNGIDFKSERSS